MTAGCTRWYTIDGLSAFTLKKANTSLTNKNNQNTKTEKLKKSQTLLTTPNSKDFHKGDSILNCMNKAIEKKKNGNATTSKLG